MDSSYTRMILNCRYHVYYHIIVSDISLKLDALGCISVAECLRISSTTITQCAPEATEFGKIMQKRLLRRSRSFKVTDIGTNLKVIYDFLLVINNNLPPISHRFRDIAFDRSKIAMFGHPSCVQWFNLSINQLT